MKLASITTGLRSNLAIYIWVIWNLVIMIFTRNRKVAIVLLPQHQKKITKKYKTKKDKKVKKQNKTKNNNNWLIKIISNGSNPRIFVSNDLKNICVITMPVFSTATKTKFLIKVLKIGSCFFLNNIKFNLGIIHLVRKQNFPEN